MIVIESFQETKVEFWLNPFVLLLFFLFGIFLAGFVRGFLEKVGAIESEESRKHRIENERQARIDALYGRDKK